MLYEFVITELSYNDVDFSKSDHSAYYRELESKEKFSETIDIISNIKSLRESIETATDMSRDHLIAMLTVFEKELLSRQSSK